MAVPAGAQFQPGQPHALFGGTYMSSTNNIYYDVSPDGSKFLMVREQSGRGSEDLNLVMHFFDQLRYEKQAGPGRSGAR